MWRDAEHAPSPLTPPEGQTFTATASKADPPPVKTATRERVNSLLQGHSIIHLPPGQTPDMAAFPLGVPTGDLPARLMQMGPVVAHPSPPSVVAHRMRALPLKPPGTRAQRNELQDSQSIAWVSCFGGLERGQLRRKRG